jgi:hypothetical protein
MSGLLIGMAVLAAVLAVAWRNLQRVRRERSRPGATAGNAITVRRFDEIDASVSGRRCRCGGKLRLSGESSSESGGRRLRLVRLQCLECDRNHTVHFDVTEIFQ